MKINELKEILKSGYSQEKWLNTLKFLSGTKNLLTILLEPKHEEIKSAKAKEIVLEIVRLGTLKTTDDISLPVYDVTLQDGIKIEYNRVGVNDLLKTHILKDAIKGAIVTFHYRKEYDKSEWRFSFISKFGSDYFVEAVSIETNPKKYTYIFGTPEEHRTALERLYNLEQSRFRLDDFFEAFNVEPVSNNFFKEYKNFYQDFVFEISNNKQSRAVFEKECITTDELEKDIRNFVKRLLGRLVFLYFLQKKRWLGASNKNYDDGDTDFLFHLFNYNEESRVYFYNKWLSPLFFNALNTPDRINDGFFLADGTSVWIPFLNGGLFDENQEPEKHREIQFPPTLFELLFKFFNGYNFTIYENSPEDHTVAVDPEMLGHIFENLLEDNKDKGAFYTPKEIVHYMTQESLIEYLKTHLSHSREAIENLIKNHITSNFTREDLKEVEKLIDRVKICDPAIGSGAFPMGLLQEIFSIKAIIHYALERGLLEWKPAEIKQNIIQNSIYGVDLENDAVDIARLRFWLSLVVDEPLPKSLPNLDFKIVKGNSILSRFKINDSIGDVFKDLNKKRKEEGKNLIGIKEYKDLMNKYLNANNPTDKLLYKTIITEIKEAFVYNLTRNEISKIANIRGKYHNLQGNNLFGENKATKKQIIEAKKNLEKLEAQKKDKKEGAFYKESFEWRFEFPDILNEDGNFQGFDIVIGNPPYVDSESMVKNNSPFREKIKTLYHTTKGNWDLFIPFIESGITKCKFNGILSYIIPNKLISANYTSSLRDFLLQKEIIEIRDYSKINVFSQANVYPIIFSARNNNDKRAVKMTVMSSIDNVEYSNEIDQSIFYQDINWSKYFFNSSELYILNEIEKHPKLSNFSNEIKITSAATVGEAYMIKDIIIDQCETDSNFKRLINTGTIDKYSSLWGIKDTQYIKGKYKYPVIRNDGIEKINKARLNQSNSPKLIIAGMAKDFECFFDQKSEYLAGKSTTIIIDVPENLKYIQALMNSKLYSFYVRLTYHSLKMAGGYLNINADIIKNLPVKKSKGNKSVIIQLVDLINYLKIKNGNTISQTIGNNHISNFFEEVIDGCVFEIYFEEHMKQKDVNIIDDVKNYIEKSGINEDFESLSEETKKQKIWELYKALSIGMVQTKMTDFVTKSPDILKPILQS